MKKLNQKLHVVLMVFIISSITSVYAQQRPFFDKSKDIIIAQFDSKPDPDDIHAQAAFGSMLHHTDFEGVNYYAVAGAIGMQNGQFIESGGLMDMTFGSANWTHALNDRAGSIRRIVNKVSPILQNGGKVWVAEAGQSNITVAWVKELQKTFNNNTIKNNVITVQHSDWNVNLADNNRNAPAANPVVMNFIRANTSFFYLDDGNAPFGGFGDHGPWETPSYRSRNRQFLDRATSSPNTKARQFWVEANRVARTSAEFKNGSFPNYSFLQGENGSQRGIDFSDTVEIWWIMNLGRSTAASVDAFITRYVTNTSNQITPNPGGGTGGGNTGNCAGGDILGFTTTGNTNTSVALSWTALGGANSYEIRTFTRGTFNGSLGGAIQFNAANNNSVNITGLTAGTDYTFAIRALCSAGNPSKLASLNAATTGGTAPPPPPTGIAIPGTIEAESFASKGGDVRQVNVQGSTTVKALGYIRNNNYTEYDINVSNAGTYKVDAFTTSNGVGGNIVVSVGGNNLGTITVPVNNSWNNYANAQSANVNLAAGNQKIRFTYTGPSGFLFNVERAVFGVANSGGGNNGGGNQAAGSYDFGTSNSPLQSGYTRITPTSSNWTNTSGLDSRDRTSGPGSLPNNLNRDFIFSSSTRTFEHTTGNGTYNVTVTFGDRGYARTGQAIKAEGTTVISGFDTAANQFRNATFQTTVSDGKLSLEFSIPSGVWCVTRVAITPTSRAKTLEIKDSISIYPNPTLDGIYINVGDTTGTSIKVNSLNGSLVAKTTALSSKTYLDLSDLATGVYIISILKNGEPIKVSRVFKK